MTPPESSPSPSSPPPPTLPPALERVVERLKRFPKEMRVQALLQFSRKVPPLPEEFRVEGAGLERVHECQTPFFLASRIEEDGGVRLFFDAPAESPTVKGFAGILLEGLDGVHWKEVLAVPADFYTGMGLEEVVSPLRLRGMGAILARLKGQLRAAGPETEVKEGGVSKGG